MGLAAPSASHSGSFGNATMKPTGRTIVVVCLIGIGFIAGWLRGFSSGKFQAGLEENKIAEVCLRFHAQEISSDFREYLKGRIYYNLASKFPNDPGYLLRRDWDFGSVDLTRLPGRIYAKDPDFPAESFDAATSHLSRAEPIRAPNRARDADSQGTP